MQRNGKYSTLIGCNGNKLQFISKEGKGMNNVKLVKKAKEGDKQAFSELYSGIYEEMYRYAYCVLQDKYDAEDIVSETVLDAYKSIRLLKDEKLFKNWIFRILSNKCKRKIATYYERNISLNEEIEVLDEKSKDTEGIMDLKNAFKELSFEEKTIVAYKAIQGYSSKEIGMMLNLNENTVRSKLSRAVSKMKCRMEA